MTAPAGDAEIALALTAFVRRALAGRAANVSVTYTSGIARISGAVASPRDARAIVDLLGCHEGVRHVVDALAVGAAGRAPAET